MNNIRQISRLMVFARVAEKGSFTRAAEALGITKSAVSQQVSQLEKELGICVLNRTTRGVSMTGLGEKLLRHCQLLQDQVNLVFTDIVNDCVEPQGRFAVTFPHALEANVVIPAMEQLCIEYPGLLPELVVSDATLDLIENKLNVAIHAGELPDSSYRALPIGAMTEIFCATPLYLQRTNIPNTLEDIRQHRWIVTSWQPRKMSILHMDSNETSTIKVSQFAQTNTLTCALEMALRHLGIVLLPDVVARPLLKTGELVHIVDRMTGTRSPVYTLHAYQGYKPVHVSRFHQLVGRFFTAL